MKRTFLVQFLIALGVMGVTSFLLLKSLDLYSRHGSTIVVPHLVDMPADEAIDKLDSENLEAVITDSLYQFGKDPGVILEQNPTAGDEVKSERKIYLLVSTGNPPMVEVPELRDLSLREANALLETKGLKLGKVTKKPGPGAVLDMVIKGKSIPSKIKIQKGMTVDVVIGTGMGNEKVPVPDVNGMTRNEVINLLTSMGLGLGFEKYENIKDTAKARVIKQYPTPTDEPSITVGNVVDLWYGQ